MPLVIRRLLVAACATLALTSPAFAAYTIVDVGTLGHDSHATAINTRGDVVGWSALNDSTSHAFLYKSGTLTDLGTPGGNIGYAYAINSLGTIVGQANATLRGPLRAVKFQGSWSDLGDLGGPTAAAFGINDKEEIVGQSDDSPSLPKVHGFLWKNGNMSDLKTLGGEFSTAFAISDASAAVGIASLTGTLSSHAARWINGNITDLGTFGGSVGVARAINDFGAIVGYASTTGATPTRAFFRAAGSTTLTPLGTLGGANSEALGINDSGQIIGWSDVVADTLHRAFLSTGTGMTDLNTLLPVGSGWVLYEALGINNAGQIVGTGLHAGGVHGFVMSPDVLLGVAPGAAAPALEFAGAAPNPARAGSRFAFSMPAAGAAKLALYDLSGRLVRTLADGTLGAGAHAVTWDGRDESGGAVSAGLYFARLEAGGQSLARRVSVMR